MLSPLTIDLNTIQRLSDTVDQSQSLRQRWRTLSQQERESLEELLFELRSVLEQHQSWRGIRIRLLLLPESIRCRKNLYALMIQKFSSAERSLSEIIAEESFRIGWEEVMTGQTIPLAQLWDDGDVE
jgi:hypothetical protein